MKSFIRAGIVATALLSATLVGAQEANYPNRPITWIVPMGAGGTSDVFARTITPFMSNALGVPIVVDNKPGANGVLGEDLGYRAKPDGYTVIFSSASVAANPFLKKTNYDPKNFVPVIHLGNVWLVMMENENVKAKNMQEFIALAKANPGKLTFSSWGVGGMGHLAGELFNIEAGVKLTHIPYKTSPDAMTAALSGQTDTTIQTSSLAVPQIKGGKVRGLAVAAPTRLAELPDVPTMAEVGLPGVKIDTWFGTFLPPATPKPIVDKLNAAFNAALNDPTTRDNLLKRGIYPKGGSPDDFNRYFLAEMAKFKRIISEAGIQPD